MSPSSADHTVHRVLLIANPASAGGRASRARGRALRAFEREGVPCDVLFTEHPGHATLLARERASPYDAVFVLGGDGTAAEVIGALANGGPPIGILAAGTGNVIARALHIPLGIERAVSALVRGREVRIDLGQLSDGRHFAIGVGTGMDEAMMAIASPRMKRRFGMFAYLLSALRVSVRLPAFRVKLTVDGTLYERPATFVMIANLGAARLFGRELGFGPGIRHDDGVLTACVFAPKNLAQAVRIAARMFRGTVGSDPAAFFVSGKTFRLETDPPRRAQADGELLDLTPLDVVVRPLAAKLLIPRESGRRSS